MKTKKVADKKLNFSKSLLPFDGEAHLIENYVVNHEYLFKHLHEKTDWEQKNITLFGKTMKQPRLISWYSDPGVTYTYSNTTFKTKDWPQQLLLLRNRLNDDFKGGFNSVLLNLYRNENDSMGLHSDDESELGKNPKVASLSLGEKRVFKFKHKTKNTTVKIELNSGSLLFMSGKTQHLWKHELPKSKKILKPRINLTFRSIKNKL